MTVRVHLLFLANFFCIGASKWYKGHIQYNCFSDISSLSRQALQTPYPLLFSRQTALFSLCCHADNSQCLHHIWHTTRLMMDVTLIAGMVWSAACTSHPAAFQTLRESPELRYVN